MMKKNMWSRWILALAVVWPCMAAAHDRVREKENFDFDWKFILNADDRANAGMQVSETGWQDVQLPHDWSISLNFDPKLSGSNGHLPGGIGWYRKTFRVDKKDKGRRIAVLFDGIYSHSDVYVNGQHLGFRPYGFCYQEYDLTPYLNYGAENVLAVRVNNPLEHDSVARWYTGAGIYRHAWLVKTAEVHVASYGTYVTTPVVTAERAEVRVRTSVANEAERTKTLSVRQQITDGEGRTVVQSGKQALQVAAGQTADTEHTLEIPRPQMWDTEHPYLYTLHTTIYDGRKLVDTYETVFGVRTCEFTPDCG